MPPHINAHYPASHRVSFNHTAGGDNRVCPGEAFLHSLQASPSHPPFLPFFFPPSPAPGNMKKIVECAPQKSVSTRSKAGVVLWCFDILTWMSHCPFSTGNSPTHFSFLLHLTWMNEVTELLQHSSGETEVICGLFTYECCPN